MSSFEDKLITLSELDLSKLFWRDPFLKARIQSLVLDGFTDIHYADQVSQADVADWLSGARPGELITKLLTDIGGYSEQEWRKLRNFSRATFMMTLEEMRAPPSRNPRRFPSSLPIMLKKDMTCADRFERMDFVFRLLRSS
jgi:hypothetical protein